MINEEQCPADCGRTFKGKDIRLGILRHLRTYAKQWEAYQQTARDGGVRKAMTMKIEEVEKHWKEHQKSECQWHY